MRQTDWKYLVDFLLFICIVGIVGIGLIMAFVLSEGPVKDESLKYLFGLHRHQWGDIHLYLSLAFTAVLIVHLVLEWSWIKSATQRIFKSGWRYVLISFIPLSLGIVSLLWLLSPKYAEEYRSYGIGAGQKGPLARADDELPDENADSIDFSRSAQPITVTGRMTLSEVEQATGVPSEQILREMRLPNDVPRDQTLGRLRRTYSFTLEDLRTRLSRLMNESAARSAEPGSTGGAVAEETRSQKDAPMDHQHPELPASGGLAADPSGFLITGQMSLGEIQAATGIDARELAKRLGLPANVSLDDNLGRLRKIHGISLLDVRETVSAMLKK